MTSEDVELRTTLSCVEAFLKKARIEKRNIKIYPNMSREGGITSPSDAKSPLRLSPEN